jgi:hypothetical protein
MAMVSHLHQLFNPETCQSYIHTLRKPGQHILSTSAELSRLDVL